MAWWKDRSIPTSVKREQWLFEIHERKERIDYLATLKREGHVTPIDAYTETQGHIRALEAILHQANEQGVLLERTW